MHISPTKIPLWSWVFPLGACLLVMIEVSGAIHNTSVLFLLPAVVLLCGAVFAAVRHAAAIGARAGEPFGSLILAFCVTLIEVALIISIMLSDGEGADTVARDTVFSAVMIVLNGIIGVCLIVGGRLHGEQSFQLNSASAALAVLGTLAALTFVLPNYANVAIARQYTWIQLLVIGFCSLVLYGVFLFVQTVRHRNYFVDEHEIKEEEKFFEAPSTIPTKKITALSGALLLLSLLAVIFLAEILSEPLDMAILGAGLPHALVGVIIATLVLLPEGISSIQAAMKNKLQQSINLVLGSALASSGMTIPIVAFVAIYTGQPLTLGLEPEQTVLLLMTLFVSTITLGTGRTTVLQGAVHLVIFIVFVLLSIAP